MAGDSLAWQANGSYTDLLKLPFFNIRLPRLNAALQSFFEGFNWAI
jgi:hypothetical protein